MMTETKRNLFWLALSVVALVVIGLIDYATGYELQVFVFYFIPIAIASLRSGRTEAYSIAVACALCWFVVDSYSYHPYSAEWLRLWNTVIRLVSFLMIAELLHRIRRFIDHQRTLNEELSQALDQVKLLQGVLPICSSCKKIRDKAGQWEQLESYIHRNSEADFTHGLCPDCVKKLYPDFADKILDRS